MLLIPPRFYGVPIQLPVSMAFVETEYLSVPGKRSLYSPSTNQYYITPLFLDDG